jgi:hypothetical protein
LGSGFGAAVIARAGGGGGASGFSRKRFRPLAAGSGRAACNACSFTSGTGVIPFPLAPTPPAFACARRAWAAAGFVPGPPENW